MKLQVNVTKTASIGILEAINEVHTVVDEYNNNVFKDKGIQIAIMDDESIDNSEIGILDDYEEIITRISGDAHWDWIKRIGNFRGEIFFYSCGWCSGIDLFGLRRSNDGVEIYREFNLDSVYVYEYIGFVNFRITGIAIGNIDLDWKN